MTHTAQSVLAALRERGIETVRLCFSDQHGILRGKTLVAAAMEGAFASGVGVPSTLLLKDTSHKTVFPVWTPGAEVGDLPLAGAGDLILRPDPARFYPLPWSTHSAILLCDVVDRQGDPVPFSSGVVLEQAIAALEAKGLRAVFGLEVEFAIYQRLDAGLVHAQATMPPDPPTTANLTQGHQYLTETRYGAAEEVLDLLRRNAEALGLEPRSVEIEMGPSQFEFTFAPADPRTQADRFVLFRTMVREVCAAQGLHASFMARPNLPNAAANGWHIHQSLIETRSGGRVFEPVNGQVSPTADGWIAGLLAHAKASCLLTNPTVNSYKRFTPYQLAPNRVQWGWDNRGAMIRALMYPGDPASRIENRVADTSANPHFAFAAQIHAGLAGLEGATPAPAATENPYDETAEHLPANLGAALEAFGGSSHIRDRFGAAFQSYLMTLKQAEWDRYLGTVSEWEHREYFGLF